MQKWHYTKATARYTNAEYALSKVCKPLEEEVSLSLLIQTLLSEKNAILNNLEYVHIYIICSYRFETYILTLFIF